MRYFLDTEFIEDGRTIDLISIGIVAEDGRELYVVNRDCNIALASPWVWANVIQPMGIYGLDDWKANPGDPSISPRLRGTILAMKPRYAIAGEIVAFCDENPVFWGEWPSYDWVALCQCWGTMMDLPEHFPMRCNDVVQYAEHLGLTSDDLPQSLEVEGNHNALLGAKTVKARYEWLKNGKSSSN